MSVGTTFRKDVFVVDEDGNNLGSMPFPDARRLASESNLDLVEVGKQGKDPVYRIMDEGKWKYEQKKRAHKNKQHSLPLKEMRFRLGIDSHDQATKLGKIRKFLDKGHSVKLLVQLRGREKATPDLANQKLSSIITEIGDVKKDQVKRSQGQVHVIVHPSRN